MEIIEKIILLTQDLIWKNNISTVFQSRNHEVSNFRKYNLCLWKDLRKHIVDNLQHNILTSYSDLIDSHWMLSIKRWELSFSFCEGSIYYRVTKSFHFSNTKFDK